MPNAAEVLITFADLPEVKARLVGMSETINRLRALLETWEPRARCPQCGSRYGTPACGPAYAPAAGLIWPPTQAHEAQPDSEPGHDPGDQHTITLTSTGATLTHPAECGDAAACPYPRPAAALPPHMLATGGTWTCGLRDGHLILLARIA